MEEKQPEKDDILKKKQQPTEQGKGVQIPPRPFGVLVLCVRATVTSPSIWSQI